MRLDVEIFSSRISCIFKTRQTVYCLHQKSILGRTLPLNGDSELDIRESMADTIEVISLWANEQETMNVEERGSLWIGGEIDMSISSSHPVTSLVKRDMMMMVMTWESVGS